MKFAPRRAKFHGAPESYIAELRDELAAVPTHPGALVPHQDAVAIEAEIRRVEQGLAHLRAPGVVLFPAVDDANNGLLLRVTASFEQRLLARLPEDLEALVQRWVYAVLPDLQPRAIRLYVSQPYGTSWYGASCTLAAAVAILSLRAGEVPQATPVVTGITEFVGHTPVIRSAASAAKQALVKRCLPSHCLICGNDDTDGASIRRQLANIVGLTAMQSIGLSPLTNEYIGRLGNMVLLRELPPRSPGQREFVARNSTTRAISSVVTMASDDLAVDGWMASYTRERRPPFADMTSTGREVLVEVARSDALHCWYYGESCTEADSVPPPAPSALTGYLSNAADIAEAIPTLSDGSCELEVAADFSGRLRLRRRGFHSRVEVSRDLLEKQIVLDRLLPPVFAAVDQWPSPIRRVGRAIIGSQLNLAGLGSPSHALRALSQLRALPGSAAWIRATLTLARSPGISLATGLIVLISIFTTAFFTQLRGRLDAERTTAAQTYASSVLVEDLRNEELVETSREVLARYESLVEQGASVPRELVALLSNLLAIRWPDVTATTCFDGDSRFTALSAGRDGVIIRCTGIAELWTGSTRRTLLTSGYRWDLVAASDHWLIARSPNVSTISCDIDGDASGLWIYDYYHLTGDSIIQPWRSAVTSLDEVATSSDGRLVLFWSKSSCNATLAMTSSDGVESRDVDICYDGHRPSAVGVSSRSEIVAYIATGSLIAKLDLSRPHASLTKVASITMPRGISRLVETATAGIFAALAGERERSHSVYVVDVTRGLLGYERRLDYGNRNIVLESAGGAPVVSSQTENNIISIAELLIDYSAPKNESHYFMPTSTNMLIEEKWLHATSVESRMSAQLAVCKWPAKIHGWRVGDRSASISLPTNRTGNVCGLDRYGRFLYLFGGGVVRLWDTRKEQVGVVSPAGSDLERRLRARWNGYEVWVKGNTISVRQLDTNELVWADELPPVLRRYTFPPNSARVEDRGAYVELFAAPTTGKDVHQVITLRRWQGHTFHSMYGLPRKYGWPQFVPNFGVVAWDNNIHKQILLLHDVEHSRSGVEDPVDLSAILADGVPNFSPPFGATAFGHDNLYIKVGTGNRAILTRLGWSSLRTLGARHLAVKEAWTIPDFTKVDEFYHAPGATWKDDELAAFVAIPNRIMDTRIERVLVWRAASPSSPCTYTSKIRGSEVLLGHERTVVYGLNGYAVIASDSCTELVYQQTADEVTDAEFVGNEDFVRIRAKNPSAGVRWLVVPVSPEAISQSLRDRLTRSN